MQKDIESLNEALNNAKKEISRLKNELNEEIIKNRELNNKLTEYLIDKDKNNYLNHEETNKLHKIIEQLNNEKENLLKTIHNTEDNFNNGFNEENYKQQLRDKEKILKTMEIAMNKALNENFDLKKRLSQEEQNKSQLNNIISKKNNLNDKLKIQIEVMKICVDNNLQKEKWNKNKISKKDWNIKLMKYKLEQKDEEIQKLNKKIDLLSKKLKNQKKNNNVSVNEICDNMQNSNNSKEILIPVKAKPQLFGPEINNYDYKGPDLGKYIFG